MSRLINSAIACRNLEVSLEFYCRGLGLVMISDNEFESPFAQLMGVPDGRVHQAHLADPLDVGVTMLELVEFKGAADVAALSGPPFRGPYLVGFQCDYDQVVERLRSMGYDDIREATLEQTASSPVGQDPMKIAFLRDPDGTVVELVSQSFPAASIQLRRQGTVQRLQPWP